MNIRYSIYVGNHVSPASAGLAGYVVRIIANHGSLAGICGFSDSKPLCEVPSELLAADEETILASAWASDLKEAAASKLKAKVSELLADVA